MDTATQETEMTIEDAWIQLIKVIGVLTKANRIQWEDVPEKGPHCGVFLNKENRQVMRVTTWKPVGPDKPIPKEPVTSIDRAGEEVDQLFRCVYEQIRGSANVTPPGKKSEEAATYYVKNIKTGEYLASPQRPWSWTKDRSRAESFHPQGASALVQQLAQADPLFKPPTKAINAVLEVKN